MAGILATWAKALMDLNLIAKVHLWTIGNPMIAFEASFEAEAGLHSRLRIYSAFLENPDLPYFV